MNLEDISPTPLRYAYSSNLDVDIEIKIDTFIGLKQKQRCNDTLHKDDVMLQMGLYQQRKLADLMVISQLFSNGHPLTVPVSSSYKSFDRYSNNNYYWSWNEWIKFPIKFKDLPRNTILALTMYDCTGPQKLKIIGGSTISIFGKYGLLRQGLLDLFIWPETLPDVNSNSTPGKLKKFKNRIQVLNKLMRKHRNKTVPRIDWLDRLSFREMELICDADKRTGNDLYLMVEFPYISEGDSPVMVVYYEDENDSLYQFNPSPEINIVGDPEIMLDNLTEEKHSKLSRCVRSRIPDKDAKPNSSTRNILNNVISYPSTKSLSIDEQDLIWKYRFYLSDQKKALIKFLNCVNWNLEIEVQQAIDMMRKWNPMDADDALQLLSPEFSNFSVRQYAVNCLKSTSDESLLLYLLQLVQALKYENVDNVIKIFDEVQVVIATEGPNTNEVNLLQVLCNLSDIYCTSLFSFLIYRSCYNHKLANYFFWYMSAEYEELIIKHGSDYKLSEMYSKVITLFKQVLQYSENSDIQKVYTDLQRQEIFLNSLVELVKLVLSESGNRSMKILKLKSLLEDNTVFKINFSEFDPIPFPLDPNILIKSVVSENATLFKSKLMPSRLTFLTSEGSEYIAIFKYGDDLRQDQLVLQVIQLIDNLLRRENLDLKLTPYKVLATSTKHGFVQYIDSLSVDEILTKEGSIQNYFRKFHPNKNNSYGISSEVIDTYIKSCAGYCVITYLLGVGDRHLDNLMITTNGNLFHIDFGFILGRDPKPLPPPMKLNKEMVEAMGGINSDNYNKFKNYCFTAFLYIRRHANLILNLFSLMVDANIPDIALEPDKAVNKVAYKLRLDLEDEEAVQYFKNILDVSVDAIMAVLVDKLHKFTQYIRD